MHKELESINAAYRTLHTKRRAILSAIEECELYVVDREEINVEMLLRRLTEIKNLLD